MTDFLIQLINMSVTATWLICAVALVRLVFRKVPKWIICILWLFVAFRLIVPFSFESPLSVIPSTQTIPQNIAEMETPVIQSGVEPLDEVLSPVVQMTANQARSSFVSLEEVLAVAWCAGFIAMGVYALVSHCRIKKRVAASTSISNRVYLCDDIETPFILGVFKPNIYLPSLLEEKEMMYVLAHERAHLKRLDHLWKPFGYLILSVHWFNPAVWVAYLLLCKDIEMACDEKVIRSFGSQEKKEYSRTLLSCSVPRYLISACPLAFGEVSVKQRVKSVMNYKKPAFWVLTSALVLCFAMSVFFLSDPLKTDSVAQQFMDKMMQEETTMTFNARAPYDFWSYNGSMKVHYTKMTDFQLDKAKEGDFRFVEAIQQLLSDTFKETDESASFYNYSDPVMTIMLEDENDVDLLMINLDGYMKIVSEAKQRYYKISRLQVDQLIEAYAQYLMSLGTPYAQQEYIDCVLLNKGGEELIGYSAGTTTVGGYMQFEVYSSSSKNELSDMDLVIGCDAKEDSGRYGNAVCTFSNAGYSNDGRVSVAVDYYLESNPETIYTHRDQMVLKENR